LHSALPVGVGEILKAGGKLDGEPSPRRKKSGEIGFGAKEKDLRRFAVSPYAEMCRRQDLNLHCQLRQPGPQPGASANSATPACFTFLLSALSPRNQEILLLF
jgi:hypothetical protein